tara:strand:- start:144 stop:467 length:324 start_codon:yes stop_codon:yes gene_type:complete
MSDASYGKNNKRIVFTANEHQHAKLLLRLRHDGLKQSKFFRCLIDGYVNGDSRIDEFVSEISSHSQKRKQKSQKIKQAGESMLNDLGLNDSEIDNIFDILEQEHPDL